MYSIREPRQKLIQKRRLVSFFLFVSVAALCVGLYAFFQNDIRSLRFYTVQSESMAPAIQKGDAIIARSGASSIKVGDVVTFKQPNAQLITHRIISVNEVKGTLQTQGDANGQPDREMPMSRVVATTSFSIPAVGYLIDFIKQPLGLLLLVYVPSFFVLMAELRRITAYYKRIQPYRVVRTTSPLKGIKTPQDRAAVTGILITTILLAVVAAPAYAQLRDTATLEDNTIEIVAQQSLLEVCLFPSSHSLLSYDEGGAYYPYQTVQPIPLDTVIPAGTYQVTAFSSDDHTQHTNEPDQPNERWLLSLYGQSINNNGYEQIATTGVTDDIPKNIDEVETIVNQSLVIEEPITAIRYVHHATVTGLENQQFAGRAFDELSYQEKRLVLWNSVRPGCIEFSRL